MGSDYESQLEELVIASNVIHEYHAELYRVVQVLVKWNTPKSFKLATEIAGSLPGRGELEIRSRLADPNNVPINRRILDDLIEDTADLHSHLCLLRNAPFEPWHKEVVGRNLKEWQKLKQKLGYVAWFIGEVDYYFKASSSVITFVSASQKIDETVQALSKLLK